MSEQATNQRGGGKGRTPPATIKRNVTYGVAGGVELKMDIHLPRGERPQPAPVVMYVHGGGWVIGGKRIWWGIRSVYQQLLARGYVFVSVNYRLAFQHRWPAQIEDVKCAVRYLRAHAAEYNLDPERIGAWGDSAGGHLVSLLGLTDAGAGFDTSGGHDQQSSKVQAVVDMFGPSDLTYLHAYPGFKRMLRWMLGTLDPLSVLRQASPLQYVTAAAAPFLIVHGEKDPMVPPRQSRMLYQRLVEVGAAARLVMVRNVTHELIPVGLPVRPTRTEIDSMIVEFFERHLSTPLCQRGEQPVNLLGGVVQVGGDTHDVVAGGDDDAALL